jgi:hypothetical protein
MPEEMVNDVQFLSYASQSEELVGYGVGGYGSYGYGR